MFLGAVHLSASEQRRDLTQSVRVFLAAYGPHPRPTEKAKTVWPRVGYAGLKIPPIG